MTWKADKKNEWSEDKYVFNDGALIRLGDGAIKSRAGEQTSQHLKINSFKDIVGERMKRC